MKTAIPKSWNRRSFLRTLGTTAGVLAFSPGLASASGGKENDVQKRNIKLGFDNFSVRSMKWNASELLDYASKVQVDSVLFSDLGVYESFEEDYLRKLKEKSDELGIEIQVGTNCICPSSQAFRNKYGTAEEHLSLTIQVAKALASPVARCYLGHRGDREGDGGIYRHIENTIQVCKNVRSQALDSSVKIAIENHAGDMQAWELAELIEGAGKDYVGATIDAGNATWTIEDPLASLEILAPYAATTGIRDSAVWETKKGASVQWTNMGDGTVDWDVYVNRFAEICPGITFQLEIISGGPREFPYLEDSFWDVYPRARASDFAKFVALAKKGKPAETPEGRPAEDGKEETHGLQQQFDLEQSIEFCKVELGLGMK